MLYINIYILSHKLIIYFAGKAKTAGYTASKTKEQESEDRVK
jgi:hypothetical protein